MKKNELKKLFPFISNSELDQLIANNSYKTERGFLNSLDKINDKYKAIAEMPKAKILEIEIDWNKSRTCGYNPNASYTLLDENGEYHTGTGFSASGCGYDKESTVIADICNKVLSGMLYQKRHAKKNVPYGIYLGDHPIFAGGVGASCYYQIAEFLGGKLEHVANAKTYDKYVFTFKK